MSGLFDAPLRYLITPGSLTPVNFQAEKDSLLETIRSAVAARIELVQIREKRLTPKQIFALVTECVEIVHRSRTRLLVNERFDIALAARADGVHLASTSIPADRVRRHTPSGFIVGVSTHDANGVEGARVEGADFAMLGPVFDTPDKGRPLGIDELRRVCSSVAPFPVIAVGGINASNAGSVLDSGAAGSAAIRYLNEFVKMAR